MVILQTERLTLSKLTLEDAPFILKLLNDPAFIQFVGDRGIRDIKGAEGYIQRILDNHNKYGYALNNVQLKSTGESIGINGLVRRDGLETADIGFAFLPQYRGHGYALESSIAVLDHAKNVLKLSPILAITEPANVSSIKLLEKIGMKFVKIIKIPNIDGESRLFTT